MFQDFIFHPCNIYSTVTWLSEPHNFESSSDVLLAKKIIEDVVQFLIP
jgi:hypothetical protein